MATLSKKEAQENDLKAILAKDIGANNPIFSPGHLAELHAVFSLYSDSRQKRTDIRDILFTAHELGLEQKYDLALRVLQDINESNHGNALDFEGFVRELTNKIVRTVLFREILSTRRVGKALSTCWIMRERENLTSKTCDISTISSSTVTTRSNYLISSTQWEATMPKPSVGISLTPM